MREGGVAEWTHVSGATLTRPTFTCCHCNKVTIVPLKATPSECGGFCRLCMKATCSTCADGLCAPFERRLEAMEARGRLLASVARDR